MDYVASPFLLLSWFNLPACHASASMHFRQVWLWPSLSVTQWRFFHWSLSVLFLLGVVLPYSLPSSHGVSLLLPSLLLDPFQNLWLVFCAFSTFPPQCFLPLLPILLFLCRFLLFLLRFQFPLPSSSPSVDLASFHS